MDNSQIAADFRACTDVKVAQALKNVSVRCQIVVSDKWEIFFVKKPGIQAYTTQVLKAVVRSSGKQVEEIRARSKSLSPSDFLHFQRSSDNAAARTRSNRSKTAAAGSPQEALIEILKEQARLGASDFFLDMRREKGEAYLSYKVYGIAERAKNPDGTIQAPIPYDFAEKICNKMWKAGGTSSYEPANPCDVTFTSDPIDGKLYRIRGASLPEGAQGARGATISCRMRDPEEIFPVANAGYHSKQLQQIAQMRRAPGGLICVSGPTDSGKSSSLISLLDALPHNLRKVAIEDPVEVELDHCTHVQLERASNEHGLESDNFAKILAAVVRVNPDVLMLGEIRDTRTGMAAMSMAQQGKRVFSTVHATDCAGVPARLADLGIPLKLLSYRGFFAGSISQNLIPQLCPDCSLDAHPDPERERHFKRAFRESKSMRFRNEKGCSNCRGGMRGQTLVAEVFPMCALPNKAYEFIRDGDFTSYGEYVTEQSDDLVMPKHVMAADKIMRGEIDPDLCEQRIGSFRDKTDWESEVRKYCG